jgi:hypothetical protein
MTKIYTTQMESYYYRLLLIVDVLEDAFEELEYSYCWVWLRATN